MNCRTEVKLNVIGIDLQVTCGISRINPGGNSNRNPLIYLNDVDLQVAIRKWLQPFNFFAFTVVNLQKTRTSHSNSSTVKKKKKKKKKILKKMLPILIANIKNAQVLF